MGSSKGSIIGFRGLGLWVSGFRGLGFIGLWVSGVGV